MSQFITFIPQLAAVLLVASAVSVSDDVNSLLWQNDFKSLSDVNALMDPNSLADGALDNLLINVSLSWTIPKYRETGDALNPSEIGGYNILYKMAGDKFYYSILIEDATVSSYRLNNLDPGLYEFIISAYDTRGVYSELSYPIYKVIE